MDRATRRQATFGAAVLLVLLVVAISLAVYASRIKPTEGGSSVAAPNQPRGDEVEALAISEDYRGNVAAADGKYLNKRLRVKGKVLGIHQASGSGYAVGFDVGPNVTASGTMRSSVVAILPSSARDDVAKLQDFDPIIIEGKCTGREAMPRHMFGMRVTIVDATLTVLQK